MRTRTVGRAEDYSGMMRRLIQNEVLASHLLFRVHDIENERGKAYFGRWAGGGVFDSRRYPLLLA